MHAPIHTTHARQTSRRYAHKLAHLDALHASVWSTLSYLDSAGDEIDAGPENRETAFIRALTVRHLVEQACTDIWRRFPRAYGPHPLAMDEKISRRYSVISINGKHQ